MANLYVMVGLPGSGKSTFAKEDSKRTNGRIISPDNIRIELFGSNYKYNSKDNVRVYKIAEERITKYLKENIDCYFDACNISYKRRKAFLDKMKKYYDKAICIFVFSNYSNCLVKNNKRTGIAVVPEEAIHKMYMAFDVPYYYEGFDEIRIIQNDDKWWKQTLNPRRYAIDFNDYAQESKYHTESLGEHLYETFESISQSKELNLHNVNTLLNAAIIHDNGKPFTKTFKNTKGELTKDAHYYGHEKIGSYNSLNFVNEDFSSFAKIAKNYNLFDFANGDFTGVSFSKIDDDELKLRVATLIRWHMQPYFWEKEPDEKLRNRRMNKYKKLWGDELFDEIMTLHKGDLAAHHPLSGVKC